MLYILTQMKILLPQSNATSFLGFSIQALLQTLPCPYVYPFISYTVSGRCNTVIHNISKALQPILIKFSICSRLPLRAFRTLFWVLHSSILILSFAFFHFLQPVSRKLGNLDEFSILSDSLSLGSGYDLGHCVSKFVWEVISSSKLLVTNIYIQSNW